MVDTNKIYIFFHLALPLRRTMHIVSHNIYLFIIFPEKEIKRNKRRYRHFVIICEITNFNTMRSE